MLLNNKNICFGFYNKMSNKNVNQDIQHIQQFLTISYRFITYTTNLLTMIATNIINKTKHKERETERARKIKRKKRKQTNRHTTNAA